MNDQKKSIDQITGLRGVIAFGIAYILHWAVLFYTLPEFHNAYVSAVLGKLCLFFVWAPNVFLIMSGYLIHKSYNKRITEDAISFKNFMLPKMRKIYPIVMVTALLAWLFQNFGKIEFGMYPLYPEGAEERNSILALVLSMLGLQSGYISDGDSLAVNGPSWFVAVLFMNYAIYFLVTKIFKEKMLQNLVYILLLVVGVVLLIDAPDIPLLFFTNGRGYYCFFVGVLMQECVKTIESAKWQEVRKTIFEWGDYIAMLVLFMVSTYICFINQREEEYELFLMMVVFFPSLVYLLIHGYVLSWIFSRKCFVLLGKVAMPLFLCNMPTDVAIRICDLHFGWNLDYANPWIWFMHIIISMIIVVIFHFIFEVSWKKQK